MVKYRRATQKPSNVCFTGRGKNGESGKTPTEFQCSLTIHTEDGYNSAAVQTIWQFVGFFWRAQSPPSKQKKNPFLQLTVSEGYKGWVALAWSPPTPPHFYSTSTPPHLCLKVSHEANCTRSWGVKVSCQETHRSSGRSSSLSDKTQQKQPGRVVFVLRFLLPRRLFIRGRTRRLRALTQRNQIKKSIVFLKLGKVLKSYHVIILKEKVCFEFDIVL